MDFNVIAASCNYHGIVPFGIRYVGRKCSCYGLLCPAHLSRQAHRVQEQWSAYKKGWGMTPR